MCKLQADGGCIEISRLYLYRFPSFPLRVFDVEFGVEGRGYEPEAGAIFPADDGTLEEEALGMDFHPLFRRNVIVNEGIEEAAEEDEDGECPVPGVGAVAREAEDNDEEYGVPPRGPVVLGVRWCAPAEEGCEFFHKSLYFSTFTWWAIVDLNH